jgi:AraC-like DNA-binding protein
MMRARSSNQSALVSLEFSTDGLPPEKRLPFWRDSFVRQVVHSDIRSRSQGAFRAWAAVQAIPGLRITSFKSTAARLDRSSEMVADGDDALVLFAPLQGKLCAVQRGREVTLQPGEVLLLRHEEPAALIHDNVRFQGLIFPRDVLGARLADLDATTMRAIPKSVEPLRLLVRYLDLVRREAALALPALRRSVVDHIHDLAALALGANQDTRETALSAVAAARLATVLTYIGESFADPGLSVELVARTHGISRRYLHQLLEESGQSFIQRVNELRLQKAFALLIERGGSKRRISDVAMDAGFSDVSHFNRLFRARFGDTPTGVRGGRDAGQ